MQFSSTSLWGKISLRSCDVVHILELTESSRQCQKTHYLSYILEPWVFAGEFGGTSSKQSADNKIRPGPLSPQTGALSTDVNILIAVLVSAVSLLFFRSLCFKKLTTSLSRYVIILTVTLLLDAPVPFFATIGV